MATAPESYLDQRRPPLAEAVELEGGTYLEALKSLREKGYFTPPPKPWVIGVSSRGEGRNSYSVRDKFGDLIAEMPNHEVAQLVVKAVNAYKPE